MNLVRYMKEKETEFSSACKFIVDNVSHWNSSVKDKKFTLNNDDSSQIKITKIYRYLNEDDADICRLIRHKRNKEMARDFKK